MARPTGEQARLESGFKKSNCRHRKDIALGLAVSHVHQSSVLSVDAPIFIDCATQWTQRRSKRGDLREKKPPQSGLVWRVRLLLTSTAISNGVCAGQKREERRQGGVRRRRRRRAGE